MKLYSELSIYSDMVTFSTNLDLNMANVGSLERAKRADSNNSIPTHIFRILDEIRPILQDLIKSWHPLS